MITSAGAYFEFRNDWFAGNFEHSQRERTVHCVFAECIVSKGNKRTAKYFKRLLTDSGQR